MDGNGDEKLRPFFFYKTAEAPAHGSGVEIKIFASVFILYRRERCHRALIVVEKRPALIERARSFLTFFAEFMAGGSKFPAADKADGLAKGLKFLLTFFVDKTPVGYYAITDGAASRKKPV